LKGRLHSIARRRGDRKAESETANTMFQSESSSKKQLKPEDVIPLEEDEKTLSEF
jgi:hypothetical protein